jgi:hypothetical protein
MISRTPIPVESMPGDQSKVVTAILAAGDSPSPPRRLLLGSDAYALVHGAVAARLEEVEAQRESAPSTDG